jgi:hypothetical protein
MLGSFALCGLKQRQKEDKGLIPFVVWDWSRCSISLGSKSVVSVMENEMYHSLQYLTERQLPL